jgi:hypothetical protein
MIDLRTATQRAFVQALGVPAVTGLAPVLQHVPENTQPPMAIVADVVAEAVGGKDGGLDRMTVEVLTAVREPRREALYALMAAVADTIDGKALPAQAGATLSVPTLESSDDEILEDGKTYMGTQRFTLFAQPAD